MDPKDEPRIIVIEIEPGDPEYGPPAPGQKLDNFLAWQLPRGTQVLYNQNGREVPATFHGMEWTDAGYLAGIFVTDPAGNLTGPCVPAYLLRLPPEAPNA